MIASGGYPESSTKGVTVRGIEAAGALEDVQVFHAGTMKGPGGEWQTNGGRVLGVCARGPDLRQAVARAYSAVDCISFDGAQLRRDIAWRAL